MEQRQNPTKDDTAPTLTPQQLAAVDLFAIGRNVSEVADAVGVSRQTASAWLNQSSRFQAELGRRRADLWAAAIARLRALLPLAIDVVERELRNNNAQTALTILRSVAPHELGAPTDPQSVEEVGLLKRENAARLRVRALGADIF